MTITYTDIFCGAGGSSIGLAAAGFEGKLAANHWERAIETHSANFPTVDHLCADLLEYDFRRLPRTDVLWASPECTWHSPAGGRARARAQLDLFDEYVPTAAAERSRMTMMGVLQAADIHGYPAILVENVVEATEWRLFDTWLAGFRTLGYQHQIVCVSSAHIYGPDNAPAPQWRDRLYVVLTRDGVRLPDVEPRPLAWCPSCDALVSARQAWKPKAAARRIGKYGAQYVYVCGEPSCQTVVEPYVSPAAVAIDWTDLGSRIGDRERPLAEATMRRIRLGLQMFAQPAVVAAAGNTYEAGSYVRAWPAEDAPLMVRTGTTQDGLATPPFLLSVNHDGPRAYLPADRPLPARTSKLADALVTPFTVPAGGTWRDRASSCDEPMGARTTRETDGLVHPPFVVGGMAHTGEASRDASQVAPIENPLRTILANGRGHHYLVIPMRRNGRARAAGDEPLSTVTAGGNHHGFLVKQYGGNCRDEHAVQAVDAPLGSITTKDHHWLVVPYRRGRASTSGEPLHTLTTRESAALVEPQVDVEDCRFRMLTPREHLRGQRFPDDYEVKGNKSEQTKQAGNAVSSNVAQWLAGQVAEVLG